MEDITFETLKIEGVDYSRILDLQIYSNIGEHARCEIMLEVNPSKGIDFVDSTEIHQQILVINSANGHPDILFSGIVSQAYITDKDGYPILHIVVMSRSYLIDQEPVERTFQKTTMTYEEIINSIVGENAFVQFNVSDKKIGSWCYQNGETDWQFIRRMASQCKADIVAGYTEQIAKYTIGIPDGDILSFYYGESIDSDNGKTYKTNLTIKIGDKIDSMHYVTAFHAYFENGILISDFYIGSTEKFQKKPYFNENSSCRMLTGIVEEVKKEKVRVFFDEIDDSFDADSDAWFEYATPYASAGGEYGSAFYVMPEEKDRVRVFLPSANEGTAFAFAVVGDKVPLDNTEHAIWKVATGAEILFTNTGIRLTNGNEKIYIDMNIESEIGISVVCDKAIVIDEADEVVLDGKKGVIIVADNEINIMNPQNSITIQKDKIVFQGESLHIN